MREETIKVYKFSELSETAQRRALDDFNTDDDFGERFQEIGDTVKAFFSAIKFTELEYSGIKDGGILYHGGNDDILNLKGSRAYAKISTELFDVLFARKYYKTITPKENEKNYGKFGTIKKGYKGDTYISLHFRNIRIKGDCPLTGTGYDCAILDPIYEYLSNFKKERTIKNILDDCFYEISNTIEEENEFVNSDEYKKESIEANEYEFLESGERY